MELQTRIGLMYAHDPDRCISIVRPGCGEAGSPRSLHPEEIEGPCVPVSAKVPTGEYLSI